MAYTEVKVIVGTAGKFNAAMADAIGEGFQPVSDVTVEGSQVYSVIVAKGSEYSITEAKVLNASSRKALFAQIESASAEGFTVDSASVSLESGQQFAFVYKGSKGGGGSTGPITTAQITDAGATGRSVLQAANGPAARTALGASATGSALMIAADADAAWAAVGGGAVGKLASLPVSSTTVAGVIQIGTAATNAMAGNKTLANIGGVVPSAGLPKAAAIPDLATDADLPTAVAKINALLVALRAAGYVAP